MADDTKKEEEKLEKLSKAVREGWAKKHPVTDQERAFVRDAVRRQMKEDVGLTPEKRRERAEKRMEQLGKEQEEKQERERGRSR